MVVPTERPQGVTARQHSFEKWPSSRAIVQQKKQMEAQVTLEYVLKELNLEDSDVVNVTQVDFAQLAITLKIGSRVYGTAGPGSDWDFVSVVVNGFFEKHHLNKDKDAMRDNGFVR